MSQGKSTHAVTPDLPISVYQNNLLLQDKSVAKMLGVSRATVWNLVADGRLTPVKLTPRCTRFKFSQVANIAHNPGREQCTTGDTTQGHIKDPMNPMRIKSKEERKYIAAKVHATRKANLAIKVALKENAQKYADGLRDEIESLESRRSELDLINTMDTLSAALTGKTLLRQDEIVASSVPYCEVCGVYFLINDDQVVYVGQSLNVYSRIAQHKNNKQFERFAFIPCPPTVLDRLESIYIHCLRPTLNGGKRDASKMTKIKLEDILGHQGTVS